MIPQFHRQKGWWQRLLLLYPQKTQWFASLPTGQIGTKAHHCFSFLFLHDQPAFEQPSGGNPPVMTPKAASEGHSWKRVTASEEGLEQSCEVHLIGRALGRNIDKPVLFISRRYNSRFVISLSSKGRRKLNVSNRFFERLVAATATGLARCKHRRTLRCCYILG
jgi:hypothetical protein